MNNSPNPKQQGIFKTFLALVMEIAGVVFIMASVAGFMATFFDWDLAIKIGGSKIPLIKDYFGNIIILLLGALIVFIDWLLRKESVKANLRKYKSTIWLVFAASLIGVFFLGRHIIIQSDGGPAMWEIAAGNLSAFQSAYSQEEFTEQQKSQMLFRAIQKDFEIMKFLLENGASPNSQRADGVSALLAACTWGTPEMISTLQEAGAEGECPEAY